MADVNGYGTYNLDGFGFLAITPASIYGLKTGTQSGSWYQMQGFDAVTTTKVTWAVQGAPDFAATSAAALAAIAAAGPATTPLRNVAIVATWAAP